MKAKAKPGREPKTLRVVFAADGSVWDVPVEVIARDRAKWHAHKFGGDVERSLTEGTMPLFRESPGDIADWASNEMNWSDLAPHAVRVATLPRVVDYETEWGSSDASKDVILGAADGEGRPAGAEAGGRGDG